MNREILRIAIPNIVSNITVPLMGIVSTAIAGHLGDSTATIGALAIGVSIFNFIYWNCGFVRMGTSGLTAQAFGAGNFRECTNMLVRSLLVSAALGLLVIVLQYPLGQLALRAMNGNAMVSEYFYARIWAGPAGILLFGFTGLYTGMLGHRPACRRRAGRGVAGDLLSQDPDPLPLAGGARLGAHEGVFRD